MKIDVRVLTQVAEYLGNYVYLLIDPRTMAPFYVGKGKGTRLAAHGLEAETLSASDDETPVERSRKIAVIHDIRSAGLEPEVWILRHGMGIEYTHVEAAPQLASLREQFQALGGFPDQVDTVFLYVSQDLEEDEEPLLTLKFWDSTKDEDSAQLQIDLKGLERLHSELGEAIEVFS